MFEVGRALNYIHNRNPPILHRDIKPENICICENNSVKLGDFGISKEYNKDDYGENYNTETCSTLEYMSPETMSHQVYYK